MIANNRHKMIHINHVVNDLEISLYSIKKSFEKMEYEDMDSRCDVLIEKIIELKKSISNEQN